MAAPVIYGITATGEKVPIRVKEDGKIEIDTDFTITPGDIEIGAVEIKDSNADVRANVVANDTNNSVKGLVVLNPDGSRIGKDAVELKDANTNDKVNIVPSTANNSIKGLVVLNQDGTSIAKDSIEIKDPTSSNKANVLANDVNSSVKGVVVLNPDGSAISRDSVHIRDANTSTNANVVPNDVNSSVKGLVVLDPDGSKISRDAVQIRDPNNNIANVVLSTVGSVKGLVVVNPDGTSIVYGIPGTSFESLKGYSNEIISTGVNIPNTTIITPTTGKRLVLKSVIVNTEANRGLISLDFLTSAKKVFRVYPARATSVFGNDLHIEGGINEVLTLSASGLNSNVLNFMAVSYLEK